MRLPNIDTGIKSLRLCLEKARDRAAIKKL